MEAIELKNRKYIEYFQRIIDEIKEGKITPVDIRSELLHEEKKFFAERPEYKFELRFTYKERSG